MRAMGFMEMLMILLTGGAPGNDLLDMVQTQGYWDQAGVPVTVQAVSAELKDAKVGDISALVTDYLKGDPGKSQAAAASIRAKGIGAIAQLEKAIKTVEPDQAGMIQGLITQIYSRPKARAVRRLMAIRTLGELKKTDALATLKRLLKSKELFEAEYAQAAIASIEGKKFVRPAPDDKALARDVAMLPAGCGLVAQAKMDPGKPMDIAKALKGAEGMPGGGDPQATIKQLTNMLVIAAESVGNCRLDAITFGLSKEISSKGGFVVIVARGKYDAKAIKAQLAEAKRTKTETIDGVQVIYADREFAFIAASNDSLVIVGGPTRDANVIPVAEMVAAVKTGKGKFDPDSKIGKLIKTVDRKGPLWAAARMSDSYREAPVLVPFDTITASTKKTGQTQTVTVTGRGSDAEKIAAAATELQNGIRKSRDQLARQAAGMPFLKPMAEMLGGIKVQAKGATATMTLSTRASTLLPVILMGWTGADSAPMPPDAREIDPATIEKTAPADDF